jgi:hypothetical protein
MLKTGGLGDDIALLMETQMSDIKGMHVKLVRSMERSTHSFLLHLGESFIFPFF